MVLQSPGRPGDRMQSAAAVEDGGRLTELRFAAAVKVIKSLPPDGSFQPSNDMMLKFYGYYKQATVGPCSVPRPGFWDAVGKAKWDAWSSLGGMPKEEAMAGYVDEMKLILEGMPITDEVEELLRVLGPFYELVEEKRRITQISDLSAARLTRFARQLEGFGTALTAMPSKGFAKSIVRTMEMNGTLENRPARVQSRDEPPAEGEEAEEEETEQQEGDEEEGDVEEAGEEAEAATSDVKTDKEAALPRNTGSARRPKEPRSNGDVANGLARLTSDGAQDGPDRSSEPQLNGRLIDPSGDATGPSHLASDSDSEVYCDSVDQFGEDESSEHSGSMDDLDDEESHALAPLEEDPQAPPQTHEDLPGPPEGVQCGGEDGEASGKTSRRRGLNAGVPDGSLVRRGRGSRSPGLGSGALRPTRAGGDGDGDGERWGGAAAPGGSLNEQIVVALARLQEDMQSVLERLHTLEALTTTQARSVTLSPAHASPSADRSSKKPTWWPFDISPSTLAVGVIWPFVAQWLIHLYLQRRRRRIN